MESEKDISQEVFDALIYGAIEDLRKSGLDKAEILRIIKEQFGLRYVCKFSRET